MNGERTVAYFSMEIGIDPAIPTDSGGLGVLAGDTIRSAADLRVSMIAVTLLSRKGYFRQKLGRGQLQPPVCFKYSESIGLITRSGIARYVQIRGK